MVSHVSYHIVLYCIVLYCIVLYFIVLHLIVLYCVTLLLLLQDDTNNANNTNKRKGIHIKEHTTIIMIITAQTYANTIGIYNDTNNDNNKQMQMHTHMYTCHNVQNLIIRINTYMQFNSIRFYNSNEKNSMIHNIYI